MSIDLPPRFIERFAEQVRHGISAEAYSESISTIANALAKLPEDLRLQAKGELTQLKVFGQLLLDDPKGGREVTATAILKLGGWIEALPDIPGD
jgi:hypothetical protein